MRCIELFQSYYHHSRDQALQKNGRLLIKGARKNVIQFTSNSNTLIGFSYLFVNMFQCKFFIKKYAQMLSSWSCWTVELLNRRGGWYTLVIFREKDYLLGLFWWIWIEGYFHLLFMTDHLSWSLFSFCEGLIGPLTTENIEVSSAKSYTLVSRLSDNSLMYIKKIMDQRVEPWGTPGLIVRFLSIQNNSFVVFRIKKNWSKLDDHFLHPYILSYKEALHAILNQNL